MSINFNDHDITTSGNLTANSGNFTSLTINNSNFNSTVSGLLPTIANSGDNRILTSTGSTVGINAESNLTFNGNLLNVTGSGNFASGLVISNQTASTIASFDSNKNIVSLNTSTYPSLTELSYVKGVASPIQAQLNNKANASHTHLYNEIMVSGVSSLASIGANASLFLYELDDDGLNEGISELGGIESWNINNLDESIDDRVNNLLVGTSGINISYNDNANTLTVAVDIIDCGEVLAPPNAPTGLSATPSNQSLALTWTAPAYVGSTPITGYTVEYTPSGGSASTVNTNSTSTSYTLTGLTNGTSYTVRVRAINSAGNGTYSSTTTGTPFSANLTVSVSTTGSGTSSDPYLVNTNDFSVTAGVAGTLYYRTDGPCPDCNWTIIVDGVQRTGGAGSYLTSSMNAGQTRNITASIFTGQLPRYIYFVPT